MKYEQYKILNTEQKEKFNWYNNKSNYLFNLYVLMVIAAVGINPLNEILSIALLLTSAFPLYGSIKTATYADIIGKK